MQSYRLYWYSLWASVHFMCIYHVCDTGIWNKARHLSLSIWLTSVGFVQNINSTSEENQHPNLPLCPPWSYTWLCQGSEWAFSAHQLCAAAGSSTKLHTCCTHSDWLSSLRLVVLSYMKLFPGLVKLASWSTSETLWWEKKGCKGAM